MFVMQVVVQTQIVCRIVRPLLLGGACWNALQPPRGGVRGATSQLTESQRNMATSIYLEGSLTIHCWICIEIYSAFPCVPEVHPNITR